MIRSVNGEEIKYDKKVALFISGLWIIAWPSYIICNQLEKRIPK